MVDALPHSELNPRHVPAVVCLLLILPAQAWHADEGFAVQFIESQATMLDVAPLPSDFDSQCQAWKDYYPSRAAYLQTDSGI